MKNRMVAAIWTVLFSLAACTSTNPPAGQAVPMAGAVTAPAITIPTLAPTTPSAVDAVESAQSVALAQEIESNADDTNNAATDWGLPASIAALLPTADPAQGSTLAVQKGCTACHSLEAGVKLVGPSWYNLGNIAAERVADESAPLYLYNSIIDPNQYVVETYLPGLMLQTYEEQLSDQELADLIAYLLTLKAE